MSIAAERVNPQAGQPVDLQTLHEIERFLIREARMLDEERYREWWNECLTEDIHYYLPVEEVRYRKDRHRIGSNTGVAIYNDNRQMLDLRIRRFETGIAWPEDPRNFQRRFITDIDAEWADVEGEVTAYSKFIVYRNRRQRDEATLYGARVDRLRQVDGRWRLARRHITLDQRVVLDKNLCLFL